MVEEADKHTRLVMENLFPCGGFLSCPEKQASPVPSLGVRLTGLSEVESKSVEEHLPSSVCRPWDRDDLWRRLATFKSMTWFGKPKAVDAVNCARRGWINVDQDAVSCEECNARLVFVVPSSWPYERVERAAEAFSLKLKDGHDRLCSWTNAECAESLSLFPSIPAADLAESYERRASALSQLAELPLVADSAVGSMAAQLDRDEQSLFTRFLDRGGESGASLCDDACKLISLCGWELSSRDCVLRCKLCGAAVLLTGYPTIGRASELLRLVRRPASSTTAAAASATATAVHSHASLHGHTIAGGPPPTGQNFRAAISVPVVGHNLMSRLHDDGSMPASKLRRVELPGDLESGEKKRDGRDRLNPLILHRTFCAWIAGGASSCGWRQTLSALMSPPPGRSSPPLVITKEDDDPVSSIRKLFQC